MIFVLAREVLLQTSTDPAQDEDDLLHFQDPSTGLDFYVRPATLIECLQVAARQDRIPALPEDWIAQALSLDRDPVVGGPVD